MSDNESIRHLSTYPLQTGKRNVLFWICGKTIIIYLFLLGWFSLVNFVLLIVNGVLFYEWEIRTLEVSQSLHNMKVEILATLF